MGDTTREKINYADIENLFDEGADKSSGFEDLDISSSIYEPVIVGFKDRKLVSRLQKPFYPKHDSEIIVADSDGSQLILPIEDIHYLSFVNRPLEIDLDNVGNFSEMLETFRGDSFNIQVPGDQAFDSGFFAVSANPGDRHKYIFFSYNNIRLHYQLRRLGDMFVQNRLVTEDILQNVLNKQYQLRKLRLGTILAKREKLLQKDIEKALQQAGSKEAKSSGLHAGDILIRAGLVPPDAIKRSLAIQRQLRQVKVGELLLEMGYLTEEQLLRVLAEKFRKRFINLQKAAVSDKALKQLSGEIVKKLNVAPIDFRDNRLVIATSIPDKPEICDILRERLSCPFELVISTQNQIAELIANLPD